jgi:protein SCO1/2
MLRLRFPLIALAVALLFLTAGVFIGWLQSRNGVARPESTGGPVIAEFSLQDQEGRRITKSDVVGRPSLLLFGFTHCPDICPTMLSSLTALLAKSEIDETRVGAYFVSVDPERDTPEVLKSYLGSFDPRIRGMTGSVEEVAKLTKSLGIYHAKVDTGGGAYSVDHSALMVLLDSRGEFFGTIAYDEAPDAALAKVRRLAAEGYR